ncbi:MAG: NYN domain-containing protein [Nocardioides sp.]
MAEESFELAGLPDAVRLRVLAIAADMLPLATSLPAPLKRVADFAPARRARAGGAALAVGLGDDELRERLGVQVAANAARFGEDPVTLAAVAWLSRPDGWVEAVEGVVRRADEASAADHDALREQDLQHAVDQAVREARVRARQELAEFRTENATLRRRLGEARAAQRSAEATAAQGFAAAEQAEKRAEAAEVANDKEVRRLRGRIEALEADVTTRRRTGRSERDEATIRARLLLDTVVDAASGLRRELGLPAVTGSPADRVEAEVAAADDRATVEAVSGRSAGAVLETLLSMPRARLVVDGYNVTKTAWPEATLETQRQRLLSGLAALVARTGVDALVVFDGGAASSRPVVQAPRGVKVLFSPYGVIADEVIGDLVEAEPAGRVVVVVSSDREVAAHAAGTGARAVAAEALLGLLSRS